MKRVCLLILAGFLALTAWAQRPFSRDFWLNESNTPVKVNALATDQHAYLWLGTDAGLYRFNGHSFSAILNTTGQISALATAGDTVYCGYADGRLALYTDGIWRTIPVSGQRPASRINSLVWHAGCLWACTDEQGVFAIVHGKGYNLNSSNGLSDNYAYAITFPGVADALVATDRGINHIEMQANGRIKARVEPAGELPDNIVRAIASRPADSGIIWAGMQDGGLLRYPFHSKTADGSTPAATEPIRTKNWSWGQINDVLPLNSRHAWIATEDGYLVDCQLSDEYGLQMKPHHFPGKRFRKLLQDVTGSLWCATVEGITMITDNYISYLPVREPYALSRITAMACDRHNNLYYSQDAILYRCPLLNPDSVTAVLNAKAAITCLYADAADRIWIGTLGAGLWCKNGQNFREIQEVPKLLAGQILDISGIGKRLWVSSLNGVEEIEFGPDAGSAPLNIVHHGKHAGVGSDYVYQLFPDREGNMWMATDGAGICRYDGARYRHWDSSSGFYSKVVYSITEDSAGHIWAATLGNGLYEYSGNAWQHIDRRQGLQDVSISAVAANASGQVLIVHGKGIDEWYPGSAQFRHYNRRLGMDIDSQSNALNCYATDTAGNVWVPFEHGLICFHNLGKAYDLRPGIAIGEVSLFFKKIPAGLHKFGAGENHIGFHFEGINFANPERVYYRYRLNGYDTGWVATIDESVTFPQLAPGSYKFVVQASLSPDFRAARSAEYSFSIDAPLWKRKWAIALAILLIIGASYGYLRLREQGLRRTAMLQRERMMAEYEQLKSQVNPHFLFNTLNTLASLIEEDSEAAVKYTIQLSDLYRSMLAYKDRDLIYLSEELTLLQKYVFIQQSRFRDCLHLHTDIPKEIAAGKRLVPLALQLLVENAIKHNIVSTAYPLHIHITATEDTITVRNALQPKVSKAAGAGLGLGNISRRYALMSNRPMEYGIRRQEFVVTLPLL